MSPRDFSSAVVAERLATMRQLLADLDTVGEVSARRLEDDRLLRHAVERILTQLVTLASDINAHVAATVADAPPTEARTALDAVVAHGVLTAEVGAALRPSIGLRNILVHAYLQVDLALVAHAVASARRDHAEYVRQVAAWTADVRHA